MDDISELKSDINDAFIELLDNNYLIKYENYRWMDYTKVIITKRNDNDILNEKVIDTLIKFFMSVDGKYDFVNKESGTKKVVFHYKTPFKKKFVPQLSSVNIDDFINGKLPELGMKYCRLILFNVF